MRQPPCSFLGGIWRRFEKTRLGSNRAAIYCARFETMLLSHSNETSA